MLTKFLKYDVNKLKNGAFRKYVLEINNNNNNNNEEFLQDVTKIKSEMFDELKLNLDNDFIKKENQNIVDNILNLAKIGEFDYALESLTKYLTSQILEYSAVSLTSHCKYTL